MNENYYIEIEKHIEFWRMKIKLPNGRGWGDDWKQNKWRLCLLFYCLRKLHFPFPDCQLRDSIPFSTFFLYFISFSVRHSLPFLIIKVGVVYIRNEWQTPPLKFKLKYISVLFYLSQILLFITTLFLFWTSLCEHIHFSFLFEKYSARRSSVVRWDVSDTFEV